MQCPSANAHHLLTPSLPLPAPCCGYLGPLITYPGPLTSEDAPSHLGYSVSRDEFQCHFPLFCRFIYGRLDLFIHLWGSPPSPSYIKSLTTVLHCGVTMWSDTSLHELPSLQPWTVQGLAGSVWGLPGPGIQAVSNKVLRCDWKKNWIKKKLQKLQSQLQRSIINERVSSSFDSLVFTLKTSLCARVDTCL